MTLLPTEAPPSAKGLDMTREKLIASIHQIFIEQFELEPAELTAEKYLFIDLGLDSLDIVDLITGLQRQFGISLRDNQEVLQIRTLQDVYNLCEKLLADHPDLATKFHD